MDRARPRSPAGKASSAVAVKPGPTTAPPPRPTGPYLLGRGPAPDLGLMVLPPLWVVPLLFGLAALTSDRAVNDAVFALGAVGHHLPGLLRAYGDRDVFRRFRARLVLAPLVLGLLVWNARELHLHAAIVIAYAWGVWHALAQSYGFARIYGARAGVLDRASAVADKALLVAWFLAAVPFSPHRVAFVLDLLATCGAPLPPPWALATLRHVAAGAAGLSLAAWLVVAALTLRAGRSLGALRVLTLASSVGFWWFANVRVQHMLLAAPLFEVFHDAQYLAIVWLWNRRRVETAGDAIFAPIRALFRPSALSILAYLLLVGGYGALAWSGPHTQSNGPLTLFAATSQLLHFYLDGFIWKVREPQTGAVVGVTAPGRAPTVAAWVPRLRDALVWALVLVPYGLLWAGERRATMSEDERAFAVAALEPRSVFHRYGAAERQWRRGDRQAALDGFRAVLALDPSQILVRRNLALSLAEIGEDTFALGRVAELRPIADELRAQLPLVDDEVRRFGEERLAAWGMGK